MFARSLVSTFVPCCAALSILAAVPALAEAAAKPPAEAADSKAAKAKSDRQPAPAAIHEKTVEIAGRKIPYRVTADTLTLRTDEGKPRATVFHVSYERSDVEDTTARPVLFAFNGGPGSSAVWLHLGVLGPKIIELPGDGTDPPRPPVRLRDNPLSILDVCDLVFVDPVSTGYSRAEKDAKPSEFHGLNEDIESVGDFVRLWVTTHQRWASPKFLLGESYGGIRVAGLSQHLQSRYGMSLNGVVLLSSLLDFGTLISSPGNDLSHLVFLPVFSSTAHFHGKVQGDRDALVREATDFAFGDYAAALLRGSELPADQRERIAARLAALTGIAPAIWLRHNLRVDPSIFRADLLRAEGRVIGRFDARVAWDSTNPAGESATYDPSYSLALGAFATAMLDYLGRDLGYREERTYEILTGKVQPWRWGSENRVVNVSGRLATAMRDNPKLKVLVMGGHTDLATPPEGVAHSLRHLPDMPATARDNISTTWYDGGHMFYLNPPDLEKTRRDLLEFIASAVGE